MDERSVASAESKASSSAFSARARALNIKLQQVFIHPQPQPNFFTFLILNLITDVGKLFIIELLHLSQKQ